MRTIHLGSFTVLLGLVALGLLFVFINELKDLGEGDYNLLEIGKFVGLSIPGKIVQLMPIAVLLGSILSLGSLASNSEILVMQASGVSLSRLITSVLQAAVVMALLGFILSEWVVPASETTARTLKNQARDQTTALMVKEGLWIKDEFRVLHIAELLPGGIARNVEIYQLDQQGKLESITRVESAIPIEQGWELQQVEKSLIGVDKVETSYQERLIYNGSLSPQLLQVLMIEPQQMSSVDLFAYLNFLEENKLNARAEQLLFWQKLFAPFAVIVMCLLAIPFVLGAQRQGNTGQRLLIGVLLGLTFVVVNRLVTQLAVQAGVNPIVVAVLPILIFLLVAIFLLFRQRTRSLGA